MELKYELNKEDYITFNIVHLKNSPSHQKTVLLLRYGAVFPLALIIFLIGTRLFKQPSLYWAVIALIFMVVWIAYYPKFHEKEIRKQMEKVLNEGDNTSLYGEKTLVLDDEKIKVSDDYSTEMIFRKNIKDIKVYKDLIMVYISGFTAHLVSTRNLEDETIEMFLKELYSHRE